MITVVSTISLIGIALWLQVVARIRAELGFLTACSSVIVVLYVAALAGWLAPAAVLLYIAGTAAGAVAAVRLYNAPPPNRAAIVVSCTMFVVLSAAAWLWLHGLAYHTWDEFSHWGRVAKALSVLGALPTANTGVIFKDYPPATGLFQYFIVFSRFSEGGTYFAQALLLLGAVLALVKWSGPADAPLYFLAVALGLIVMEVLGLGYATVETDHIVGGLFGAVLGAFVVRDRLDRRSCLALAPVLFSLPLIKPIGIVTALFAAGVIALDVLRTEVRSGRPARSKRPIRSALASVAICAVLVAAPCVAHLTWQFRTEALKFSPTFKVAYTGDGLRTLVTPSRRTPTQQLTVTSFFHAFRQAAVGRHGNGVVNAQGVWVGAKDRLNPSSAPQWFVCLAGLSFVAFFLLPREVRTTHAIVQSGLAAGCVVYLALLLYVYLYGFGSYEATRVISFGRYVSTWFLGWGLALIASLGVASRARRVQHAASVLLLVVAVVWAVVQSAPREDPEAIATAVERRGTRALARAVEGTISPTSPTYIVWQASAGFPFHLTAYELSPRLTNSWCWTVGQKYNDDDVWTCPLSLDEFSRALDAYEYLLIGSADDRFWDAYQGLFEEGRSEANRSALLFRIVRHGTAPKLRRVAVPEPQHD